MVEQYKEIRQKVSSEFTEQKSKFIGYAFLVKTTDEVKTILAQLRLEHNNANHVCYAYRLGKRYEYYRFSDDGEPGGTAGRPIYGQIEAFELTNILVASVRYFGGIKLGTGGLVSNYQKSAKLTLKQAEIIQRTIRHTIKFYFDYSVTNQIQQLLHEFNAIISKEEYAAQCYFEVELEKSNLEGFLSKLSQIQDDQTRDNCIDITEISGIRLDRKFQEC